MVDWYNWSCRKSHVIQYAADAGTDYPVKITVHYGAAVDDNGDNGEDVYVNGLCKLDFGDILFTSSDGTTRLPFWMESKTDGKEATFWVKVSEDLSSVNRTIYIYYNNPYTAGTESNGDDTFMVFDDFEGSAIDTDKWNVTASGQFSVADSWITCTGNQSDIPGLTTKTEIQRLNVAIEAKINVTQTGSQYIADWRTQYSDPWVGCLWYAEGTYDRYIRYNGSYSWEAGTNKGMTTGIVRSNVYITDGHIRWETDGTRNFNDTFTGTTAAGSSTGYFNCIGVYVGQVKCDFIFVRKYVNPEPQHGSWGSMEIDSTIIVGNTALVTGYASKGTTITSSYDPIIKVVTTTDNVLTPLIQNIIFAGNGTNTGIMVEDVYGCAIRNVTVKDCETGIKLRNTNVWTEGTNITHTRLMNVEKGLVFDVNGDDSDNRSFAYSYIEDLGISLKDAANCTGIVVGPGAKPYSSFMKANVWMQNATNNIGINIQKEGADPEKEGQIRGGLVNIYVAKTGTTGGIGAQLDVPNDTSVQENQSFLLTAHNVSTVKYNILGTEEYYDDIEEVEI